MNGIERLVEEYGKYFDIHVAQKYSNMPYTERMTYREYARRKFLKYCIDVRPDLPTLYAYHAKSK